MRGFYYLGDWVNASGACEAAATARARISWVRFRECGLSELCKIGNVIWE